MPHNTIMADSQIQSRVINSIIWELATLVHREDNSTSTSQQLLSLNWPIELPDHQIQPDWSICEKENFNWLRVFRFTTHRTAFTTSSYFPGNFSVPQTSVDIFSDTECQLDTSYNSHKLSVCVDCPESTNSCSYSQVCS